MPGPGEEPRLRDPVFVAAEPQGRLRHHQPLRLPQGAAGQEGLRQGHLFPHRYAAGCAAPSHLDS